MPVYNEGDGIEGTVLELYQKTIRFLPNSKVIIFEDGSTDDTRDIVNSLAKRFPWVEAHASPRRKGYPTAVRDAISFVSEDLYEFVVFMDSDGQYDPSDFFALWTAMSESAAPLDIIVGKRTTRTESKYRVLLSSGLGILEGFLFSPPCTDITSAFRLMRTKVAREVALQVKYSKYNFWLEFTARMSQGNYAVREVAVSYRSRTGSGRVKSNVYDLKRMPKILSNELGAVARTWFDFRRVQLLKFLLVGTSGAAVILVLTYLLTSVFGLFYAISAGIAIEASIFWAFAWNDKWTFRSTKMGNPWYERLAKYNLVSLGGEAINEVTLVSLVTYLHVYYLPAEAAAIVVAFGFNFLTNLKWTWR